MEMKPVSLMDACAELEDTWFPRVVAREVVVGPGEVFVVPAGTRHNPRAEEECWIALLEPASTRHTGDVVTDRTRSLEDQMR